MGIIVGFRVNRVVGVYTSCSLNSLKGDYIGDYYRGLL